MLRGSVVNSIAKIHSDYTVQKLSLEPHSEGEGGCEMCQISEPETEKCCLCRSQERWNTQKAARGQKDQRQVRRSDLTEGVWYNQPCPRRDMTNPPHSFQTAAVTLQTFYYHWLVYLRRVHYIKVRLLFSGSALRLWCIYLPMIP